MATALEFTPLELRIVRLLHEGFDTDALASALGVSRRTAQARCDELRVKLGVAKRRQIPAAFLALTGDDPWAPPKPKRKRKARA